MLTRKLREAWPGVEIIIRGDSDFCRWKLMRWCENHKVDYCFGIARWSAVGTNGRTLGLRGTELARAQAGTIRARLLKIGARILSSTRRIVFKLASGYPLKALYMTVVKNLGGQILPTSGFG
jgi:hypothetical protein